MPWWLWYVAGCEEQYPSSGKRGREQGWWELGGRSQETGGARHQPGEALHSRPPQERWQDSRPWPLETLLADAAALKNSESLLCTILSVLFILALINFPGQFMLTVLPGYLEALEHLCLIALINLFLHSCWSGNSWVILSLRLKIFWF